MPRGKEKCRRLEVYLDSTRKYASAAPCERGDKKYIDQAVRIRLIGPLEVLEQKSALIWTA
jgi:hypothetical protein